MSQDLAHLLIAALLFIVGSFWAYVVIYYAVLHALRSGAQSRRGRDNDRAAERLQHIHD